MIYDLRFVMYNFNLVQKYEKEVIRSTLAYRAGDVKHSLADSRRACDELGYAPTTDIPTGLMRCIEWWRQRSTATASKRTAGVA